MKIRKQGIAIRKETLNYQYLTLRVFPLIEADGHLKKLGPEIEFK
jgi:hypothetical protein